MIALHALAAVLAAAPVQWKALSPAARTQAMKAVASSPLADRLVALSAPFLEVPYIVSPLGEGEGKDPDPMIRFDGVDCLTFVEQTIALGTASTSEEVLPVLNRLRYREALTYEDRNHLMEAEWLPQNIEKGYLRDVTRTYGAEATVEVTKSLTETTWGSRTSRALDLPKSHQPTGVYRLDVVPLAAALDVARKIPSGTIFVVVREDRPLLPTRITHLGFIVQKQSRTYLRHASRTFGRVVDEDLSAFLGRNGKYGRWKVTGLSFFEVTEPSTRAKAERP